MRRSCVELASVAAKFEFEPPEIQVSREAPLMIASARELPCEAALALLWDAPTLAQAKKDRSKNRAQDWTLAAHSAWADLGRPEVRVFLPEALSCEVFESAWDASAQGYIVARPIEVVSDSVFESTEL